MAVKVNASGEGNGGSAKLFTGVAALRVTYINPTQEQMKEIGYKAEKAPVYKGDFGTKVVMIVEGTAPGGHKLRFPLPAFFLKDKLREDLHLNKFGNFGKDASKLEGDTRHPYDGEIELLNFIREWANLKKGEELSLDNIKDLIEFADTTELKGIMASATESGNVFKALLTVRDGKYQSAYNKKWERGYSNDFSYLHKSLVKEQAYIKEDLGGIDFALYISDQFKLKEWKGEGAAVATAATNSNSSSNGTANSQPQNGSAGSSPAATADDDEAPF